jgi:hypothetical protein
MTYVGKVGDLVLPRTSCYTTQHCSRWQKTKEALFFSCVYALQYIYISLRVLHALT